MLWKEKPKTYSGVDDVSKGCTFTTNEDTVMVALPLFIEVVMVCKVKKTQFDVDTLGLVDDQEVFRNYD